MSSIGERFRRDSETTMKETTRTEQAVPLIPRRSLARSGRAANLRINIEEFHNGVSQVESLPPVLFVELTQNCNLHCRMCRSASGYQTGLNMADALFDRLKRDLFPYASIVDLRGWGESTVLRNLADRITQTALAGPRIRLVTNALAITGSLWALLMGTGSSVIVSVNAATPDTMRLLGRGSFEKLTRSLDAGVRERDRAAGTGTIRFNAVVSSLNLNEIPDIVRMAAKYGVDRVTMFPVVASRNSPLHLDHRIAEVVAYLTEAAEAARNLKVELRLGASLHEEVVVTEGLPNRCSHPWEYCYIDYAGNVGYCDHLIGYAGLMLGNLGNGSFDSIWNGAQFQELRRLHAKARRGDPGALADAYAHCGWCYKRRYVDFEDDTNASAEGRIVSTGRMLPLLGQPVGPHSRADFMSGRKLL